MRDAKMMVLVVIARTSGSLEDEALIPRRFRRLGA